MSDVIKRVSVEGLRGSDVATIQVLTQDVLGLPVNQISASTVCDLFALAEVSDQVPEQLASDLSAFVARAGREMADMADLGAYASSLLDGDAAVAPETFRSALSEIMGSDNADLAGLAEHWSNGDPLLTSIRKQTDM